MTYPKRFEGYWIEKNSNTRCENPKKGRHHIGAMMEGGSEPSSNAAQQAANTKEPSVEQMSELMNE